MIGTALVMLTKLFKLLILSLCVCSAELSLVHSSVGNFDVITHFLTGLLTVSLWLFLSPAQVSKLQKMFDTFSQSLFITQVNSEFNRDHAWTVQIDHDAIMENVQAILHSWIENQVP